MTSTVLSAMRRKGISQRQLAEALGVSDTWVSRFLGLEIKQVKEEQYLAMEDFLDVRFFKLVEPDALSDSARTVARRYEKDPRFSAVVDVLSEAMDVQVQTPRYFKTEEMSPLGQKIAEIVNDPANAGKFGKIARKVLELIG